MREEWEKYLLGKVELHTLKKRYNGKPQQPKGFGILDGVATGSSSEKAEPSSISKLENDALLAAASEISCLTKEKIEVGNTSKPGARMGGSRKGKSKKAMPKAQPQKKSKKSAENKTEDNSLETEGQGGETNNNAPDDKSVPQGQVQEPGTTESAEPKHLPPVQFYALERDQHILDVWKPSVIVVYHPDMTFVREIEVYKAENPLRKLKVYFLFYEDSTEVQKFEASIRRENGAFESLIRQKSLMMIPVDQVAFSFHLMLFIGKVPFVLLLNLD